jgi:ActR/RegA family two-component response regulator
VAGRVRVFSVLYTSDAALVSRARARLRRGGVPAVAVDSTDELATLACQAMPTHVVVDERCGSTDALRVALGPRSFDVTIVQVTDDEALLAAVFAMAP